MAREPAEADRIEAEKVAKHKTHERREICVR